VRRLQAALWRAGSVVSGLFIALYLAGQQLHGDDPDKLAAGIIAVLVGLVVLVALTPTRRDRD
jgi:hypothetical protein